LRRGCGRDIILHLTIEKEKLKCPREVSWYFPLKLHTKVGTRCFMADQMSVSTETDAHYNRIYFHAYCIEQKTAAFQTLKKRNRNVDT
jgi:hypothetical protein